MTNNELLSLRKQILGDIVPLVLESAPGGADQFALLLRVIQAGNANGDIYRRAYESAKQIENTDDRLEALLALLDEVDFDASRSEQSESTTAPAPVEPQAAPQVENAPEHPPTYQ